jgi:hypothetical protein
VYTRVKDFSLHLDLKQFARIRSNHIFICNHSAQMITPPDFATFKRIGERIEEEYEEFVAKETMAEMHKSGGFHQRVESILELFDVHAIYAENVRMALDLKHDPDDVVSEKLGVNRRFTKEYIPLKQLIIRVRIGLALDKAIIRIAWAEQREKANEEFAAFSEEVQQGSAAKRARTDDVPE